jgi:hypothetical protein
VAWHQTLWVETRTDMFEMHLRCEYMVIIGLVCHRWLRLSSEPGALYTLCCGSRDA